MVPVVRAVTTVGVLPVLVFLNAFYGRRVGGMIRLFEAKRVPRSFRKLTVTYTVTVKPTGKSTRTAYGATGSLQTPNPAPGSNTTKTTTTIN